MSGTAPAARVLLVCGDDARRAAAAGALRALACEVAEAPGAPQALGLAGNGPDLVLLDLATPGLDAGALLAVLRKTPAGPVLALLDGFTREAVQRALDAGAEDVLAWDRLGAELPARLRALLRGSVLARHLAREREWLDAALGVARATSGSLDLDEVLGAVVRAVGDRLGAARCSLLLVDEAAATGRAVVVADRDEPGSGGLAIDLSRYPELSAALSRRDLVVVDDAPTSDLLPEPARETLRRRGIRSLLVVPLVTRGAGVGAILLRIARVRPFSDEDLDFCRVVAASAASAVHNSWLYQRAVREREALDRVRVERERALLAANATLLRTLKSQDTSLQDEDLLTGEPFFLEMLGRALAEAAAEGSPLAVAVLRDRGLRRRPAAEAAEAVAELVAAARGELPGGGRAILLSSDRVGLVVPGGDAAGARTVTRRLIERHPDLAAGLAVATPGEAARTPEELLAAAEAAPGDARPRILVVEDEPEVGEILDAFFSAEGRFEVVLARTGADAIEKARERPPDVALLDLELPDMDGGEVLQALRRSRKDLPALACSGKRPESAAGAGFSGFFKKPLDMAALVDHVERMLKRRI